MQLDVNVEGGAKDYMVTLSPAPEMVDGKKMYEEGTEVTLTANRKRHHHLQQLEQW